MSVTDFHQYHICRQSRQRKDFWHFCLFPKVYVGKNRLWQTVALGVFIYTFSEKTNPNQSRDTKQFGYVLFADACGQTPRPARLPTRKRRGYCLNPIRGAKHPEWVRKRTWHERKKHHPKKGGVFCAGDAYGNRTHVTAVKGPCLNRLTNAPSYGSGSRI